jgi:hypothetical protein
LVLVINDVVYTNLRNIFFQTKKYLEKNCTAFPAKFALEMAILAS